MNTVIIAAAPVTKDKFHPVIAEFPIADKALLKCVGSHQATDEILAGACKLLGVNPEECVGCSLCSKKCPVNAISGEVKKPFSIDNEKCIKCGRCMDACRFGAVERK